MNELLWLLPAGCLIGLATGLVPGLHVNTLAAIGLALVAAAPPLALMLLAAGTVHTVVNILPATFLGAPDDDDVPVVLPAHRLLMQGRAMEAIGTSVAASTAGLVVAVAAAPVYAWLLVGPPGVLRALDGLVAPILAALLAWIWWREASLGRRRATWALAVMAACGALGAWTLDMRMDGPLPGPGTPLLPLLAGLFGMSGLLASAHAPPPVPFQVRAGRPERLTGVPAAAALASMTAVLPGITAAVATSLLPRRDDPRHVIAAMSCLNTAHAVLAVHVLLLTARVRTGLADVLNISLPDATWTLGGPTAAAVRVYEVMLVAGVAGAAGTLWLGGRLARNADRLPARGAALAAVATVVAITAGVTGAGGVLLLAACACIGLAAIHAGVRRITMTSVLMVPVLLHAVT